MGLVERFLRMEASGGFVLLLAAAVALIWANVSFAGYEAFWETDISLPSAGLDLDLDLRHWINDLLMAVFFCLIALEVKREVLVGELRERSVALVPIAAAVGGMVAPALVYLAVNSGGGGEPDGWAIPIATDVAFALAVLSLIGGMAPGPLRAFLLTVAIVDDVGTIVVIALFYSGGLALGWLAVAVAVAVAIVVMQRAGLRALGAYVIAAGLLWLAIFESGVHGTIAGVIVGFLTPMWVTDGLGEEGQTVASRLEEILHPWSAYAVLPVFALANAGVPVSLDGIGDTLSEPLGAGIVLGLVIGKPLGILLAVAIAIGLAGGRLPPRTDWSSMAGLGAMAGVGFTVALFISGLALDGEQLEHAKLAILLASLLAAAIAVAAFALRAAARR